MVALLVCENRWGLNIKEGGYNMSNIVRKGDFLVFVDVLGRVTEFFISSQEFDLLRFPTSRYGRISVDGCFGFRLKDNYHYEKGCSYLINRKATLEERDHFLRWLEYRGYKFNNNTLELTLNR